MPTVLSHTAVPLALALSLGPRWVPLRLLALGLFACVAPDLDVMGFQLGVSYGHEYGHRGASHSIAFAGALALLAAFMLALLKPKTADSRPRPGQAFLFVFIAGVSHPLLDMFTNGGYGVALFWPWSDTRWFFPSQVIQVSPLSLERFFGPAGLQVLMSELYWIWLPAAVLVIVAIMLRRCNQLLTARKRI